MDNIDKAKRNKIIIAAVAAVLVFISVVIGFVIYNNLEHAEPEDTSGELVGDTTKKFVVFYNRDILTIMYNIKFSSIVTEEIENFIMSDEEMKYSEDNSPNSKDANVYYDATIDVKNLISYDTYTNKFEVNISDHRKYQVITQTDSLNEDFTYVYMAISREGSDTIFVFINGNEKNKNNFIKFAKEKLNKTLVETKIIKLE